VTNEANGDALPGALHVAVDRLRCQGHNRCVAICPEVFDADDYGYSVVKHPKIGPELEAKALLAEANCPEAAIAVSSDPQDA
jgi:ferredoxin